MCETKHVLAAFEPELSIFYFPDRKIGIFILVHTICVGLLEKVGKRYQLNLF